MIMSIGYQLYGGTVYPVQSMHGKRTQEETFSASKHLFYVSPPSHLSSLRVFFGSLAFRRSDSGPHIAPPQPHYDDACFVTGRKFQHFVLPSSTRFELYICRRNLHAFAFARKRPFGGSTSPNKPFLINSMW